MKARKIFSGLLCFMLALLLLLSGCEQPAQNPDGDASSDDVGLEYGFDSGAGCESPPYECAYRSPKAVFDIDDVTLEFFFGGHYPPNVEAFLKVESIPSFEVCFIDEQGKKIVVQRVDENFVSEKYKCTWMYDENWNFIETAFNHSETLTVPKEIFLKETGSFSFQIRKPFAIEPDFSKQRIMGTRIFYKTTGNTVTLSRTPFE